MPTIRIKCDAAPCQWAKVIDIAEAKDWLHAPCPECGAAILTDSDMDALAAIRTLVALGLGTIEDFGYDGDNAVHIDTAKLALNDDNPNKEDRS